MYTDGNEYQVRIQPGPRSMVYDVLIEKNDRGEIQMTARVYRAGEIPL